jgi:hypothetical protein
VDAELEAPQISAAWIRDLVLDRADGPSSLAASLSTATELLVGHIDAAIANAVHWETWSVLVTALLQFLELGAEVEVLRSRRNVDLMEYQMGAL